MSYRIFLTVHSAIYSTFAIALFFIPSQMWPIYGVEINDKYALFLSQHTSIFLGGIAIIGWFLRGISHDSTQRQLLKALIATNALGVTITTYAGAIGIFVGLGWSDPLFFASITALTIWQYKKLTSPQNC